MGKTIAEKILARASGRPSVSAGDYLQVTSRCAFTVGGDMWIKGPAQAKAVGAKRVFDPEMVHIVMGHAGSAAAGNVAEQRVAVKEWAREMGIPLKNLYDLGRQGVEHIFASERCWALPGETFFQSVNGHTTSLGALGAFAVTLSYGSGAYLVTGHTWLRVPGSARFHLTGRLSEGVTARDVFEYVLGQVGPSGAPGQVMEWAGPAIEAMSMDGRFTLCCHALFTGAWTAIINPDRTTLEYLKARTSRPFEVLTSDPDAEYARSYSFDVTGLVPQVALPPKRYTVKPVPEVAGVRITRGFIGSCSNGRLEDMRLAARILKGRRVRPDVVLNITPGSVDVLRQCIKEGLLDTFIDSGAVVPSPACGMCYGANTPLGKGEVCIATSTCNYPGRMGSTKAEIYLASPATVAAACIEGRISDPRNYL